MAKRILVGALVAVLVPVVLAAVLAGALVAGQYTRAAGLLVRAAELGGWPRAVARLHERPVRERALTIPSADGPLRARAYAPEGGARRTVVLISGVHPDGIDEPRLIHFARSLAAVGLGVVTPDLPRLTGFEIEPVVTDRIEEILAWAAGQPELAPDGRVGVAGISFSGGLALVAAGRAPLRDRIAFVLSVGGHGELLRTLDELTGGILAEAPGAAVDPFGLAIVLASVADRVVPGAQAPGVREWARTFLEAAHRPFGDPARARGFREAERLAAGLPEPGATFVRHVLAADSAALRPHLVRHVRELASDPALSPERAPPPAAPVYLLHGADDPIIPPRESLRLAEHLRPHTRVRVLLSPVLGHADVEPELRAADAWELVIFLADLLRQ